MFRFVVSVLPSRSLYVGPARWALPASRSLSVASAPAFWSARRSALVRHSSVTSAHVRRYGMEWRQPSPDIATKQMAMLADDSLPPVASTADAVSTMEAGRVFYARLAQMRATNAGADEFLEAFEQYMSTVVDGRMTQDVFEKFIWNGINLQNERLVKLAIRAAIHSEISIADGLCTQVFALIGVSFGNPAFCFDLLSYMVTHGPFPTAASLHMCVRAVKHEQFLWRFKRPHAHFVERIEVLEGFLQFAMVSEIGLSSSLINGILVLQLEAGMRDKAFALVASMSQFGLLPNTVTVSCLIQGLCKLGDFDKAKQLFDDAPTMYGVHRNGEIYVCARDRRPWLFRCSRSLQRAYMNGLLDDNRHDSLMPVVLKLYHELQSGSVPVDQRTCTSAVSCIARVSNYKTLSALERQERLIIVKHLFNAMLQSNMLDAPSAGATIRALDALDDTDAIKRLAAALQNQRFDTDQEFFTLELDEALNCDQSLLKPIPIAENSESSLDTNTMVPGMTDVTAQLYAKWLARQGRYHDAVAAIARARLPFGKLSNTFVAAACEGESGERGGFDMINQLEKFYRQRLQDFAYFTPIVRLQIGEGRVEDAVETLAKVRSRAVRTTMRNTSVIINEFARAGRLDLAEDVFQDAFSKPVDMTRGRGGLVRGCSNMLNVYASFGCEEKFFSLADDALEKLQGTEKPIGIFYSLINGAATFGQTAKLEEYVQMMERQRTFPDYAFTKMLESARELCQENAAKRQQ